MLLGTSSGMTANNFKLIVGNPNEVKQETIDSVEYQAFVMDRIKFYFNINEELESWVITKPIVDKPLFLAYEAYMKSKELDEKGKIDKNLSESLQNLKYAFLSDATNLYSLKDYEGAYINFKKSVEIGKNPLVNQVDTLVLYYTGLSAQLAKKLDDAIPFYKQYIEYGNTGDGSVFYNTFEAYKELGKPEEGLQFLEEGFTKFPNNQNILYSLIQYYLDQGEDPSKVFVYLNKAIEQNPNESSLLFAAGTLHDKLGNFEEAVNSYTKALEINADFFDAAYNLGALYYNRGVKFIEEANKVPAKELDKYDALMEKANLEFKKCIPFMEKAHEINSTETNTLETLKNLYFRFRNESEEYAKKLEETNKKIEQNQ
ncbi:MAG TPA: tetratricopeptide repeat protein [Tenuifilaceae bacterium]|nr:tetratricopeptide repeat protein [Tenuifilaceae bacterium]HPJ45262.1 tetratricopeptide repeat protein [Tenuifilaceae bacterium]HPQ33383.1 tetratricopeptide repeat protein [Tenuifilaceae bacterium]